MSTYSYNGQCLVDRPIGANLNLKWDLSDKFDPKKSLGENMILSKNFRGEFDLLPYL